MEIRKNTYSRRCDLLDFIAKVKARNGSEFIRESWKKQLLPERVPLVALYQTCKVCKFHFDITKSKLKTGFKKTL